MSAYAALETRFRDIAILDEVSAVLHWDWSVMMPPKAAIARGEQMSALRVLSHKQLVDPAIGDLLEKSRDETLSGWQAVNRNEMQRCFDRASALPEDLVANLQDVAGRCETAWRAARENADFNAVAPLLSEVVDLTREQARLLGSKLNLDSYDALLDGFDPGLRYADFADVFEDYAEFLPTILDEVLGRQAKEEAVVLPSGPFNDAGQRALVAEMIQSAGFPLGEGGRLDESAHPFSTGYGGDARITIGVRPDDPFFAIMSAMHECGHALYEIGLPEAWRRQPVGDARGMSMHESQSLIVEMQACRSMSFARWIAPLMCTHLGEDPAFTPENLYRHLTKVERGFIRIEADEVTYPAHVILRTRLERALLSGDLSIKELPTAWRDQMKTLLGIEPPNDALGCLQDIHWYDGAFGYFPTYTLGAMTAAQLMEAARAALPELDHGLEKGDFSPLVNWLGDKVHTKASLMPMSEILVAATGRTLDPSAFKRHIKERYGGTRSGKGSP